MMDAFWLSPMLAMTDFLAPPVGVAGATGAVGVEMPAKSAKSFEAAAGAGAALFKKPNDEAWSAGVGAITGAVVVVAGAAGGGERKLNEDDAAGGAGAGVFKFPKSA